ncbi:MAG: dihydrolipoyl dehydrogenase, partial [Candidatus Bipolaricaulota bacterium]
MDFKGIMDRMRDSVRGSSQAQGEGVDAAEGLDWYNETGEFVGDYVIKVGDEEITAPNIFIVAGSRPL